jgi:hypothetical protein
MAALTFFEFESCCVAKIFKRVANTCLKISYPRFFRNKIIVTSPMQNLTVFIQLINAFRKFQRLIAICFENKDSNLVVT